MKLWLDDIRFPPDGFDIHVKTEEDAIKYLDTGLISHISFDHDLGEPKNGTGYGVAKWIESEASLGILVVDTWEVHSANPVGRKNIEAAMKSADAFIYAYDFQ